MKNFIQLCLLLPVALYSQQNDSPVFQEPTIDGKPYRLYFEEYIHTNFKNKLDTLGINGISFVRFTLSKNNSVEKVECDSETKKKKLLSVFFEEMIYSTTGKWANVSESKLSEINQVIVLPISYSLQHQGKIDSTLHPDIKILLSDFFGNYNSLGKSSHKKNEAIALKILSPVVYFNPFDNSPNWKPEVLVNQKIKQ